MLYPSNPKAVPESKTVESVRVELEELQLAFDDDVAQLDDAYDAQAEELQEIAIRPLAKNVHVRRLQIGWVPYVRED